MFTQSTRSWWWPALPAAH
ncbi:trp operon leader peptide [Streptomyces sp. NRRL B-1347]